MQTAENAQITADTSDSPITNDTPAAISAQGGMKETLASALNLRYSAVFNYISLALLAVGIGLVSLQIGSLTATHVIRYDVPVFGMPMFLSYFSSAAIIVLNLLPPLLLIFLIYFVSGRAWIAFTFPSAFILLLSLAHFFKMQVRGDPLVASDLFLLREAAEVLPHFSLVTSAKVYLSIIAFILGVLFSIFALKYKMQKTKIRIIGAVSTFAASLLLYSTVYTNTSLYDDIARDRFTDWSFSLSYVQRGFLYPFTHSIQFAGSGSETPPEGFCENEARQIAAAFEPAYVPEEKRVNIITIMLEAYSDLSVFDVLDFKVDVFAPLHRIQEESISGTVINNVFAAGTNNTERLFLTGFTRLTEYTTAVNSHVRFLNSLGYHTEGFTAVAGWFYDRTTANHHLGFARHYFLEDFENSNQTDEFFFRTIKSLYTNRDRSRPYFSFNLSAQNHAPYPYWTTNEPYLIHRNGLSDESFNILNNYLTGIYDTTRRLYDFVEWLRHDPDPVVLIVSSDHMPWLGNHYSVYNELGILVDSWVQEGFMNRFSTPYFIWANYAAREALGNDFIGYGGSFSPGFLLPEAFNQMSWRGDWYIQALNELRHTIDIIFSAGILYRENGQLRTLLTPQGKEIYERFLTLEFFRRNFLE